MIDGFFPKDFVGPIGAEKSPCASHIDGIDPTIGGCGMNEASLRAGAENAAAGEAGAKGFAHRVQAGASRLAREAIEAPADIVRTIGHEWETGKGVRLGFRGAGVALGTAVICSGMKDFKKDPDGFSHQREGWAKEGTGIFTGLLSVLVGRVKA